MRFSYPNGSTPLDGFTIERGIGVGGFGEVYYAISTAGKKVALKKIQRNLDIELRGVKQCINLKHVNLISLWDIRTNEHDENWVVMEYVPGPSLRDVVQAHPQGLPAEDVKRWFLSTASGVAYLHQKDIVHRDLKPGNIFLDEDTQVIKIGDYGLSKFISTSRRSGQTESVGTFHYMAPEIGRGVYGKEIDIYALGIILFEILTGDVPFDGESTQEIIMKHLTDTPNVDRVPAGFRDVIRKALQKDPELRYHDVPEMLADMPWPEVAENCQNIISLQSVGPLFPTVERDREYANSLSANPEKITHDHTQSPNATSYLPESAGDYGNGRPKSTATVTIIETNNGAGPKNRLHPSQLPPSIISHADVRIVTPVLTGDADIVFGPLQDLSQAGPANRNQNRISIPSSSNGNATGQFVERIPEPIYTIANPIPLQSTEPIARVMRNGMSGIGFWWNNASVSTPLKLFALVIASIVFVQNSQWLLPLGLGLGLIYLMYYALRSWLQPDESSSVEKTKLAVPKKISKRDLKKQTLIWIREELRKRPATDRATELLGSLLVAAMACLVFNLLGLAVGGSMLKATIESWAIYAWLTTTSVVACWLLLMISKFWEDRAGEHVLRRLTMSGVGLAVGLVAFFSAATFSVNLTDPSLFEFAAAADSHFVIKGMPMLPAYLIFFTGLFGILRWWNQTDPVRSTRLSILSVSLCLIWASVFSHLLELPMTPNCILAVVISISIQLAAPWLPPAERSAICVRSN